MQNFFSESSTFISALLIEPSEYTGTVLANSGESGRETNLRRGIALTCLVWNAFSNKTFCNKNKIIDSMGVFLQKEMCFQLLKVLKLH